MNNKTLDLTKPLRHKAHHTQATLLADNLPGRWRYALCFSVSQNTDEPVMIADTYTEDQLDMWFYNEPEPLN